MHKSLAVDRALIDYDDARLRDGALPLVNAAKQPDAHPLYLWPTVPGIGTILRLVRRDDLYDIHRFPRGQEFASSCRLVTCPKESPGHRAGSSGTNIGQAPLTGAFAEAAVLCLQDHPAGPQLLVRLEQKHGQGNAFTSGAHQLARAVYSMGKRKVALARHSFLTDSGRGGGEPDASLDPQGMNLLETTLVHASLTASLNA